MNKTCGKIWLVLALCALCGQNLIGQENIELIIMPGKHWTGTMWAFLIPIQKTPQLAAWVETTDGQYVETLFVTGKAAKKTWLGSPQGGRPDSLPVWYAVSTSSSVDAESSATPAGKEAFASGTGNLESGRAYVVKLEVNHSFDYNDAWPKKAGAGDANYSGVNGQPSVIYEGKIVAGQSGKVVLEFLGQGSVNGSIGRIVPGSEGLTTALSIIESAIVETKREKQ